MTASKLEEEISKNFDAVNEVIFNFEQVKYISSSGIRVLVGTSKKVNNNMKILKPTDEVMKVFTITGLGMKFNIKK